MLPNLIAEDVEKFEKVGFLLSYMHFMPCCRLRSLYDRVDLFVQISYQITEDNSDDNFVLDTKQNVISLRVKKPLDRDNMPAILQGVYTLTVSFLVTVLRVSVFL